jgi:hypothetical protein
MVQLPHRRDVRRPDTRQQLLLPSKHQLAALRAGQGQAWKGEPDEGRRGSAAAFVFGVQARSPAVLAGAGGVLLLLAVIATLPPAIRAMRVDISRGTFN